MRDLQGFPLLMQLLTADDSSYGEQVAAASVLSVCALAPKNKRVMLQLSVLESAWRLLESTHELALEVTCCVCGMMTDDG